MKKCVVVLILSISSLSSLSFAQDEEASPIDYVCDGRYLTAVSVDGLQSDWEAEAQATPRITQLIEGEAEYDWTGGADASFKMWCRYDEENLYFTLNVRDNVIVGPEHGHDGDRVEFWFNQGTAENPDRIMIEVPAWPVHDLMTSPPVWGEGGRGEVSGARGELAPRPDRGYFLEVSIPYSAFSGNPPGFAPVQFAVVLRDWDYDGRREHEVGISNATGVGRRGTLGTLHFTQLEDTLTTIRTHLHAEADQVPDVVGWGNYAGDNHLDQIIVLNGTLALFGSNLPYSFLSMDLGLTSDARAVRIEAHDIDGDNFDEIIVVTERRRESVEHDNIMLQSYLSIFDVEGESISRVIYQEIANEVVGIGRIEAEISYETGRIELEVARRPTLDEDDWYDVDGGLERRYRQMPLPWRHEEIAYRLENGNWISVDP